MSGPIRRLQINQQTLFLTFDDGPCEKGTPETLKLLADQNAKATFFVIANEALKNKRIVQEILAEGHALGDHSLDHGYGHFFKQKQHLKDWIQNSHQRLEDAFSVKPVGFRSPAGVITPPLTRAIEELDIAWIHWSQRFFDTNIPIAWTLNFRKFKPGDIVLLHDKQKESRRKAYKRDLSMLMTRLLDKGFDFRALHEEEFRNGR